MAPVSKSLKIFVGYGLLLSLALVVIGEMQSEMLDNAVTVENEDPADADEAEQFIPTHEWQVVKPGQVLPTGLHVRLSMSTGGREAKLLDDSAKTDLTVIADTVETGDNEKADSKHRHLTEAMEEAFKELQSSADAPGFKGNDADMYQYVTKQEGGVEIEELRNNLGQKYKSMEEIKKKLSHMNVNLQTDIEILQDLYKKYTDPKLSDPDRLTILEDFEYYVHQVDNARDFADMGGFHLILKDLNHTNDDVRAFAAFVIGSAAQSNPPVQIVIIELHIMQKLIHMLSEEKSIRVRLRTLYALSALIRHFPYAQQRFLSFGGLQVLYGLFSEDYTDKLKIKAVTLVTDLVKEQMQNELELGSVDVNLHQEKLKQYQLVPIAHHLQEQGWCDIIPPLLSLNEHDYREKTLKAMTTLHHVCADSIVFKNSIWDLNLLETKYKNLAQQEKLEHDADGYYQSILDLVENLKRNLNVFEKQRTEL